MLTIYLLLPLVLDVDKVTFELFCETLNEMKNSKDSHITCGDFFFRKYRLALLRLCSAERGGGPAATAARLTAFLLQQPPSQEEGVMHRGYHVISRGSCHYHGGGEKAEFYSQGQLSNLLTRGGGQDPSPFETELMCPTV